MRWIDVDIVTSWPTAPCRESWCHDIWGVESWLTLSHICIETLPVYDSQTNWSKNKFSGKFAHYEDSVFVISVEAAWSEAGGWSVTVSESGAWPVPPWGSHSGTAGQSRVPGSGDRERQRAVWDRPRRGTELSDMRWRGHNVRPWSLS